MDTLENAINNCAVRDRSTFKTILEAPIDGL